MASPIISQLPVEVELIFEVMPCRALRETYDSAPAAHPCSYFGEWGHYHTYDYKADGPPAEPNIVQPAVYGGKREVVPELLSGCRKAPILCVGINPNLPGYWSNSRNAIHPYFDDALQFAHYFRYRTTDKLRIPEEKYEELLGSASDSPASTRPLTEVGGEVPTERAPVLMYEQYRTLLEGLAARKGWQGHRLSVGEDIAYANMVACPSARWVVTPNSDNPTLPVMGQARARGIVGECFYDRRYFLRQLLQSLPAVILVFSRTTAREFITALGSRFSVGDPSPDESLNELFKREIRLQYGTLSDGTVLDARVVFMPHASANPDAFAELREPCVDRLVEEVDRGNLELNQATGHLARGRGACAFCTNSLYRIGKCDYENELRPLATGLQLLSSDPTARALADKAEQLKLLDEFTAPPAPRPAAAFPSPMATAAPRRMVLKGKIATMAGQVIDDGAVYIAGSRIEKVQRAGAAAPAGFQNVEPVETEGVLYPGLLDLHNHLPYNILPLWLPPRRFDNRDQWQRRPEYRRDVTEPMGLIVRSGQNAIKAIIRYIEVKLLLGGVTSGQGMRSRFGGTAFYSGLVRNFEQPADEELVASGSRVLNLVEQDVPEMRRALDEGVPYFFHLAEGLDTNARQQFTLLEENQLLRDNLVGIHSLALRVGQHRALRRAGARVVWSPLSNMLLYGQTIDPGVLRRAETVFGLGSDWTPSGSRNILQELKVAWLCAQQVEEQPFDFEELAHAVTIEPARAVAWQEQVGSIEQQKRADLLVLDARSADPFENLVRATEREVRLVFVDGVARYGDAELLEAVAGVAAESLEEVSVGERQKALHLAQHDSPLGRLSFAQARARLEAAMSDLEAIRNSPEPIFEPLASEPRLELELDMQAEEVEAFPSPFAVLPPLASLPLDAPTVIDDPDYFDRLESIAHLPAFLKGPNGLRRFYR